jgi:hypothetical protein
MKRFPMIFGLDQTSSGDGCATGVFLTGFSQEPNNNTMLIAGYVNTATGCAVLGVVDPKKRGFLVMVDSTGKMNTNFR